MSQEYLDYLTNLLNISLDELRKIEIPDISSIFPSIENVSSLTPEVAPPATRVSDEHQNGIPSLRSTVWSTCRDCDIIFTAEQYRQHVLSIHTDVKIIKTEECELEAENLNPTVRNEDTTRNLVTGNSHDINRHNHHRRSKSKKLTKECPSCKEKFSNKRSLKLHQKTHKKENHFYCNICLYGTHNIRNFNRHNKQHMNDELHTCYYCGMSYKIKASLEKHLHSKH